MSTIVVKNLPAHLDLLLEQRAKQNHRPMTKAVVHLIEAGLQAAPARRPLPPPVKLRSGRLPSIDEIEAAIAEGHE